MSTAHDTLQPVNVDTEKERHSSAHLDEIFETVAFVLHGSLVTCPGNDEQLSHEDFWGQNSAIPNIQMELVFQVDNV